MIVLHVDVREPVPDEEDSFEGHAVVALLPSPADDATRELVARFLERVKGAK